MKNDLGKTSDHEVAERESAELVAAPAPKKKIKKGFFASLRRESKRDRQLAALSDGYQQLVGLMSSIQMNMEMQAKNQHQLLGVLENLPEVADGLKKMGRAAEHQTEVIELMRDQLTSNVKRDKQLSKNVSRINKTLVFTNFLFVLGIAIAAYVFMSVYEKPLLPTKNQEAPAPIEESVEGTPGNEPLLIATPTNKLDICADEAVSNTVSVCEMNACTNAVEPCTNMVEACTNSTEFRPDIAATSTNIAEASTHAANISTNLILSDGQ